MESEKTGRRGRQTTTRGWFAAEDLLQVLKPTAVRPWRTPLASARCDAKPKANRRSEPDEQSEVRQERERTSRPAAPSADNEAPRAQESNKVIGADTDKATGKQPESKKKETRKKKVLAEIGTRMEQQASESCKMSGGSSATRQQERIGRGSACPHFRGGLVVEGLVE